MSGSEPWKVDPEILIDYGYIQSPPANNARHWTYGKGDHCDHILDLPFNESRVWCPVCSTAGQTSQLKKIFHSPFVPQVWHEFYSDTTERVETDRKKMESHLRDKSDQVTQELGIEHSFVRNDVSDLKAQMEQDHGHKISDDALRRTHDQKIKDGRKQSKGRFTFTLGGESST